MSQNARDVEKLGNVELYKRTDFSTLFFPPRRRKLGLNFRYAVTCASIKTGELR